MADWAIKEDAVAEARKVRRFMGRESGFQPGCPTMASSLQDKTKAQDDESPGNPFSAKACRRRLARLADPSALG